jgi:oligopeptide/dipeptide ABC transporter ATP-binding protein
METILRVEHLWTELPTSRGPLIAVRDVSFELRQGEMFGLVGESGSGKSMTCRSILQLVPEPGRIVRGQIHYGGRDLARLSSKEMDEVRGKEISMIFQDPTAVLDPVIKIGDQITEVLMARGGLTRRQALERAIELLRLVGIPDPERRLANYPHEFSGGMCQRVVIAIALACQPRVILADEPTTALDVTIQDQILKLISSLQAQLNLSLVLITHNLGVVAQSCQRVAVMYAGMIMELATTDELFEAPRHPYTLGLLNCVPRLGLDGVAQRLTPIPGQPPDLVKPPSGCPFHPRCPLASAECTTGEFPLREVSPGHFSECIKYEELERSTDIWRTADERVAAQ